MSTSNREATKPLPSRIICRPLSAHPILNTDDRAKSLMTLIKIIRFRERGKRAPDKRRCLPNKKGGNAKVPPIAFHLIPLRRVIQHTMPTLLQERRHRNGYKFREGDPPLSRGRIRFAEYFLFFRPESRVVFGRTNGTNLRVNPDCHRRCTTPHRHYGGLYTAKKSGASRAGAIVPLSLFANLNFRHHRYRYHDAY